MWVRASGLRSEGAREPHVTLDHVAHVLDAMAEHQGPLDPHPEGEAGVALGVDPAGDQDPRVDHPAAPPLDPALRPARPARALGVTDRRAEADEAPDVDLGGRL